MMMFDALCPLVFLSLRSKVFGVEKMLTKHFSMKHRASVHENNARVVIRRARRVC